MDGHLRAFRRLCRLRNALLLVRISVFAALVPLLTRLAPPRLDDLLAPRRTHDTLDPDVAQRIVRYVDLVLALGRPIVRPSCMTRGLTLYYFLSPGVAGLALCFGVANLDGKVAGHCWLSRNGEPFLEPQDPRGRFTELYRFPLRRRASMAAREPAVERGSV
jgi:Transglutaminase-like superfamily